MNGYDLTAFAIVCVVIVLLGLIGAATALAIVKAKKNR